MNVPKSRRNRSAKPMSAPSRMSKTHACRLRTSGDARANQDWSFLEPFEAWSTPRANGPFRETCKLLRADRRDDVSRDWPGRRIPGRLRELWTIYRRGDLFRDVDYGQWGLELLSPKQSNLWTRRLLARGRLRPSDLIVGLFRGDGDLLLVDRFGRALVADLGRRRDWHVEPDLRQFLLSYVSYAGAKYWEGPSK
jgi:hypothetical protein